MLFAWSVCTQVKGCNESYGIYNARDDGGIRNDNYVERPPMLGQPFNGLYNYTFDEGLYAIFLITTTSSKDMLFYML